MQGDCSKTLSPLTLHINILYINIMKELKAADLVWIATAQLQREQKNRAGFLPDEILRTTLGIEPNLGFSLSTIRTHISRHCVANLPPAGSMHRMLTRNANGTYRLYRHGDEYDPGRAGGKTCPDTNAVPSKYKDLIEWFHREYDKRPDLSASEDPLLALRGLGKELWKELGGGEKFIHELRANWYGTEEQKARVKTQRSPKRRAG
jgi:hypothetical protein